MSCMFYVPGDGCNLVRCTRPSVGDVQGVSLCDVHLERGRREAEAGASEDPAVRASMEEFNARIEAARAARIGQEEVARAAAAARQEAERQRRERQLQGPVGRCVRCARPACLEARSAGQFLCEECWINRNQPTRGTGMRCTNCEAGTLRHLPDGVDRMPWARFECTRCAARFEVWQDMAVPPPRGQPTMRLLTGMVPPRPGTQDLQTFAERDRQSNHAPPTVPASPYRQGSPYRRFVEYGESPAKPKKKAKAKKEPQLAGPTTRAIELPED